MSTDAHISLITPMNLIGLIFECKFLVQKNTKAKLSLQEANYFLLFVGYSFHCMDIIRFQRAVNRYSGSNIKVVTFLMFIFWMGFWTF